ncbi:MAG: hypothetical protein JWM12_1020 [Ilumatobacteraceae bacterium]|nr:hypothetical protein [Ilumatobacteraceae bacterium]
MNGATTALPRSANGGRAARRALVRWSVRLFRREWRQQLLVLSLLTLAVAATIVGIAIGANATTTVQAELGSASHLLTIDGHASKLSEDLDAARAAFGTIEVISHQDVVVPGSVAPLDLRDQDPHGAFKHATLRLVSGRYPTGPDEAAVTDGAATALDVQVGVAVRTGDRTRQVVGVVENPLNLSDEFVLVPTGQATPAAHVSVLAHITDEQLTSFHTIDGTGLSVQSGGDVTSSQAAAIMLAISTVGMLFIGLLAVSGFTVMAQRRLRALGMLESIGATDRHVRLVMLANGAVVGLVSAIAGAALGLTAWLGFAPHLERILRHRVEHVNRFDLPWWALVATMALAFLTAVVAAWWPARSVSRVPVVAALSGRPPDPQPAHRSAAVGALLAGGGYLLLFFWRSTAPMLVAGILATTIGMLFLAPVAIRALAAIGGRAPVSIRLALRDLVRYQARSGAALGAITLAIGIAATIAVADSSMQATADAAAPNGNLRDTELVVYLGRESTAPIPDASATALATAQASAQQIVTAVGAASAITLQAAINPDAATLPPLGNQPGGRMPASLAKVKSIGNGTSVQIVSAIYVATPELLASAGLTADGLDPAADIVSPRDLNGLQLELGRRDPTVPKVQVYDLAAYTSEPTTMISTASMQRLNLQPITAGWLIRSDSALTSAQISAARRIAADAGLTIETRTTTGPNGALGTDSTTIGALIALAVLAMTVGLIRSETAGDLRTLTAAGASTRTRRWLVGATAGALGLLGAVLGILGAHLAVLAWNHGRLGSLAHTPIANLLMLIVGLPLVAMTAGWVLAGRQPPTIARAALT